MRKTLCLLTLLLGWLAGCQSGPDQRPAANYLTTIPDPKTLGETYVSNPDAVLDPATVADLNQRLDSLDRTGRAHIDVAVVRSIGEEVPKMAAHALFNQWKIGDRQRDNGLLLLLVLDQRRIEMETGYGLEGDLPDAICYRIQRRYMLAPARAEDYDQAVRAGVAALIRQLRPPAPAPVAVPDSVRLQQKIDSVVSGAAVRKLLQESEPEDDSLALTAEAFSGPAAPPEAGPDTVAVWVIMGLTLLLYVVLGVRTAGERGLFGAVGVVALLLLAALGFDWPPTAGQLAAICYGLAGAYLVGYLAWLRRGEQPAASPAERLTEYQRLAKAHAGLDYVAWLWPVPLAGYWWWHQRRLHQLRHPASLPCPTCGQPMQQLAEAAAHLSPGQQAETQLESVAHDVWACARGHVLVQAYPDPDSPATTCPACHFRTLLHQRRQEVLDATTQANGWGWDFAHCTFCQHERKTRYTIPRRQEYAASSSSSSGSSSSWGSSSGSSGSSGSSSSGGSSGGGGAGSSW